MQWSWSGPVKDMRCTQILEPADPHTWSDNYLCVSSSSPLRFTWSSAGPPKDHQCIKWSEGADPHTWSDNYLCKERCKLTEVEVLDNELLAGQKTGTRVIGSVFGGACLSSSNENLLSLRSLEEVKETMDI